MIINKIAEELSVKASQVNAAVKLLDEGATVPFIARYRKEATEGLDDTQLRNLEQRLTYLRELEERRDVILRSIDEQGKLTSELKSSINQADSKTTLEDLYLPFKPRRRTKGQIAIEAGLEPLADTLFNQPNTAVEEAAGEFVNAEKGIADTKAALEGARFILMERFAEDASLLGKIRDYLINNAHIKSVVAPGKEQEASKYKDYFSHSEKYKNTPSHRALAMFRGRNEGLLHIQIDADPQQEEKGPSHCEHIIASHYSIAHQGRPADDFLAQVVQWTWKIKIGLHMETELFSALRERAEKEAIEVFAKNLNDLLMAAPAGAKTTMGLDPGLRTGVKVAIVDSTGKVVATNTIFPHAPQNQWDKSSRTLATLCKQYKVDLISIGNGTGSRETDKLVGEVLKNNSDINAQKIMVSEAGASVYSASELASKELPTLDVSIRGAVSIARRLQDPLAELVKIEPKAIGVGQYQHDVSQSQLGKSLDRVIEDCVNAVGVDVNTASPALLSYVSGLNKTLAHNIVKLRDSKGAFSNRKALLDVERLGPKAFEQAAGFLRIVNGTNPLDASSVHPEAYPVVDKIVNTTAVAVNDIIGNTELLKSLSPDTFTSDDFGIPTVKDIFKELEKPGRDPRPEFKTASFKEGVETINDLKLGMILEGVVSNVANFGAFVDVGVHQDGLVHISALTDKFISDPREVVKAGDIVKVKVMDVDVARKRISFTMRLDDTPQSASAGTQSSPRSDRDGRGKQNKTPRSHQGEGRRNQRNSQNHSAKQPQNSAMGNAFADALAKAKK
ncbi:MAG: RNA-binding transcriptional accessory protein [Alteromonas sp.]|uniref:Tex family protein n=1 Tax=unclassified Alteromonas TaxID=2614992 RepID=UPI00090452D1|nr:MULTISPECIES: Tex family protein [unclassified Alteromonas]APE07362.1 RNA-binding transcriptional accessory protein [Alteromonas sp. RW2A1]AUC89989.1 RNA-binding transcriptional accessory protein [Alteromonas sp. MB-3u-76]MAI63995.1 RNA-binding transcriptional accessory protein [Alteromonas sp.]